MSLSARALPAGTVTFLFTDIEGSTRLLQQFGSGYEACLEEHRRILRAAVAAEDGHEVNTEGDAFFVVFASAARAVAAALAAQRALAAATWPEGVLLRVRMGLHTGEATPVGRDYVGLDVHRAARICAAAWGGQILLSQSTRALIERTPPEGATLLDLGEHRLKDLLRPEHIFQLAGAGLPAEFPPPRTLNRRPHNLPVQLTSFVGRTREVAEARRLFDATHLLTLTGPGGTGKTRLSLELAAGLLEQFEDGVYFVALAPISDPSLVASTIAQTLGLQESGRQDSLQALREYLGAKRMLLILDNFEQVAAAAPVVGELLKAAPEVKILVTSRIVLRVYGEQEFAVPPLGLPDRRDLPSLESLSQYEAVTLFIQRALTAKPDFAVTNDNAPAVAEIVARLDGLPLAIELAAARIKLLTPQAMLSRLEHRLSLLTSGARDLPARQQTLRGAITWSYDLLDDAGRRLLARLSVFVGGASLDAVERVCGPASELGRDVLDGVANLVDHSLLRQEEIHGEPRFTMLETIREFAGERLEASGEAQEIRRRHAETLLAFAREAEPQLTGRDRMLWLDRLEDEHDNFRAALAWTIESKDTEAAMRLGAALWRFWQMRGHLNEASVRLTAIRQMVGGAPATRALVLEAAGGIAYWQGDLERAHGLYEESLALQREIGDLSETARAVYNLSFTFFLNRADMPTGQALLKESLELYERAGDEAGMARVHWAFASHFNALGDYAESRRHLDLSLPVFRRLDDRFSLGWGLHVFGLVASKSGDLAGARAAFAEGLALFYEARDISGLALLLDDLSSAALTEGDVVRAARLAGAAAVLQKQSGTDLANVLNKMEGRSRPGAEVVDEQTIRTAWNEGQSAPLDRLIAYALGHDAALSA
jgi:predicted ATPase/class 3 adenylate cyclase